MNKFLLAIKLSSDIVTNIFTKKKIILISEGANWVINEECKNIKNFLKFYNNTSVKISITPTGVKNKVIHFFSVNTFIDKNGIKNNKFPHNIHTSNKIILTWFHISEEDNYRLKYIPYLNDVVDFVHTASEITKNKLIEHGLNPEKIVLIPLGVDTTIFKPVSPEKKERLRNELDLPSGSIIIGSFQKDGNGWGEGLEPKLIKGPDIFCDVVEKLSKHHKIHILLTGPSRGYVKKRLSDANIPYTHIYLKNYFDVVSYYQVLDLYLICSREEGGPKALLETMATGIPLVSTRVGMVPEVIEDSVGGLLCNIEDIDKISKKASSIITNEELKKDLINNSLIKIKEFDVKKIGKKFYKLYNNLSNR
ncbi:MAG: glycosyl transferase, group 1 [uncultured bacterium]|nr:MAG: glycosyl transferase, group 1 [uncultured bacterium]HAV11411.1 hypothetical protein [Candidatus Moranbacteria bacterium]